MNNGTSLATTKDMSTAVEQALIGGDLSRLSTDARLEYYRCICESLGLNYLTKPFDYINLNGKLTLYAKKDATEQLRKIHRVSLLVVDRQQISDVYMVTARATLPDGRTDESIGAVTVAGLKGDALANAFMKAETKAKRRVTLSICGLGILDETELETVSTARVQPAVVVSKIDDYRHSVEAAETLDVLAQIGSQIAKEKWSPEERAALTAAYKAKQAELKAQAQDGVIEEESISNG